MAWPIVTVLNGGIPVTEAANGFGTPVEEAPNGLGTAVTFVDSGGIPVVGGTLPPAPDGFVYLLGADGANLSGGDGNFLLGVAL